MLPQFQNLHEGSVSCLEGTHSGRLLFSGGADGLLMAHDLRMKEASRVLWHHNAGVNGLALEDPWLVSAASGGFCRVGIACCPARRRLIGQAQLMLYAAPASSCCAVLGSPVPCHA
jgi:hypothetical protein